LFCPPGARGEEGGGEEEEEEEEEDGDWAGLPWRGYDAPSGGATVGAPGPDAPPVPVSELPETEPSPPLSPAWSFGWSFPWSPACWGPVGIPGSPPAGPSGGGDSTAAVVSGSPPSRYGLGSPDSSA
jgi:hypothetical protein